MKFVLDASTALAWCFMEGDQAVAGDALGRLVESEAYVPVTWSHEVASGLLAAERRKMMTAGAAARAMRILLDLPIVPDASERSRAFEATWRLARTHDLSVYDAAYLELAIRHRVPLATFDAQLQAAAAAEGLPAWDDEPS